MPEVAIEEVRRFMEDSLVAAGATELEAQNHAALLLHADCSGHFSHGLNRLEFYINDLKTGCTKAGVTPRILKESPATAWVDGGHALGSVVGNFCMDLAIRKARDCGVGWVSAKGSNHFGMAGYWALKAEKEGLIGMAFTNSSPMLVPTRAKESALGTNPIGMAAPAMDGDSIVVDMATTAVAMGKIEVQIHKGEPIPEGWAFGPNGEPTTDAQTAFQIGRMMPLGGLESTSGYKGYGLSAMVEVFCSMLGGSPPTHKVRMWSPESNAVPPNLGQCYVAIDPGCFAPGFECRLSDALNHWRNMEPADPCLPVLAPGDKEKINADVTTKRGTIKYVEKQIAACAAYAQTLGVKPLRTVSSTVNGA